MAIPKKSWREKLADSKDLPKTGTAAGGMSQHWGTGTFVIPAPVEVDALMQQVPLGRVVTINDLRAALAARHRVNFACPLTTGIFAWIAANAATEAEAAGERRITPFWRTLKNGGEINPKYPGGAEAVAVRLRGEGHQILKKGKRLFVAGFEQAVYPGLK
jgi:hypothetical protein